jgi:hypothetical protein
VKKILTAWIGCIGFIESQGQFVSRIKQANTFTLSLEAIYVDDFAGLKPSYLGPPETRVNNQKF